MAMAWPGPVRPGHLPGDGRAERRLASRALIVDVDPLRGASGVSEGPDVAVGDRPPLRSASPARPVTGFDALPLEVAFEGLDLVGVLEVLLVDHLAPGDPRVQD